MSPKKIYGLIGYPLSHSFSKKYFTEKFEKENILNSVYLNFEIDKIELLSEIIENNEELKGLNVTIPYKQSVIPYLTEVDAVAKEIGAVNTIKVVKDNNEIKLKGYNTDYYGFLESLKLLLKGNERNALIFGNGGAAKAVIQAVKTLRLEYKIVSRTPLANDLNQISYSEIDEEKISSTQLFINTTPLGMWPNTDKCIEFPYHAMNKNVIAYDLIYNPEETLFMRKAKENGAIVSNGLKMLYLQAEKAWEIYGE